MDDEDLSMTPATPEQLLRMSRAVLACPIADMPATPVTQLALGWLRAAHDQLGAIADLMLVGRVSATAPNARSFSELAIRLIWLHGIEDRSTVMPALVKHERDLVQKHVGHSAAMGVTVEVDEDLLNLELSDLGTVDASLTSEARAVVNAARAAGPAAGIYQLWQSSTQFTHATTQLAIDWAAVPSGGHTFVESTPDREWVAAAHLASILICTFVGQIMEDEGATKDQCVRLLHASIGGLAPEM